MGRSPKSEGIEEVPRQPSGDASRPRGSLLGTCPKVREPVEQRAPAGRPAVGYGGLVRQTRCSPFLGKKAKCKSPRNGFPAGAGSTARRGLRGTCPPDTLLALPRTSESGVRGARALRESPGNPRGTPPDPVGASSALVQKSENRSSSGRRQDGAPWATGDSSARHAARPSSEKRPSAKVRGTGFQRPPAGRPAVGYGGPVRQTRCSPFLGLQSPRSEERGCGGSPPATLGGRLPTPWEPPRHLSKSPRTGRAAGAGTWSAVGYGGLVRQTRCSPFLGKKAKCKSPRNGFPAGAGRTARRGLRGTCPPDTLLALPRTSESGVPGARALRESPGNPRGAVLPAPAARPVLGLLDKCRGGSQGVGRRPPRVAGGLPQCPRSSDSEVRGRASSVSGGQVPRSPRRAVLPA